jgi:excisionase family DNA binding protein
MMNERELSAIQAARALGVGLDYLYSLLWTGKLKSRKVGNRWRVSAAAVQERLNQRERRNE